VIVWRQEHADADLEEVPADMVMASGSGLDPRGAQVFARFGMIRKPDSSRKTR